MKLLNKNGYQKANLKEIVYSIKKISIMFFLLLLAFSIIKYPLLSAQGVSKGIEICLNTLIPTLYPFMVISSLLIGFSNNTERFRAVEKLMQKMFRLPASTFLVVLFSSVGGFPVGARLVSDIYSKGYITEDQGKRMMLFCVNPGPAFVIGTVGGKMYGNEKAGWIIYISVLVSSFLTGIISALFAANKKIKYMNNKEKETDGISFIGLIKESGEAMLSICGWVLLFSCITELITAADIGECNFLLLSAVLEVTNGCIVASKSLGIHCISAIISFAGLCTHLQLWGYIKNLNMKYSIFFAGRIFNSLLSGVVCYALSRMFPIATETFSTSDIPLKAGTSVSSVVSVLMVIMSLMVIIGDDYKLVHNKKIKKY